MKRADPRKGPARFAAARAAAWLAALVISAAGCASQEQASVPVPGPASSPTQAEAKADNPAPPKPTPASPAAENQTAQPDNGKDPDLEFFADDDDQIKKPKETVPDPLEPFNRVMFSFNDVFYRHVLTPVARGYRAALPVEMRTAFGNFFHNLGTPLRVISAVLQGDLDTVGLEVYRFATNTTVGVLGFGDAAKDLLDLPPPSDEDLGQTLGVWGFGHGFYLVWPVLGPSSLRDTVGMVGGWYADPVYTYVEPLELAMGVYALDYTNDYSFRVGDYESLVDAAVDPYVAMRDFYLKYRRNKLDQ